MITPIYACLLTFFLIYLSMNVTNLRKQHHVGLGDGGNDDLTRAIRAHGNFIETVPWAIFLIFLIEYQDGNVFLLHALGIFLLAARVLHFQGLKKGALNLRVAGTVITLVIFGVAALYNLLLALTVGV